ncbi:formate hydrogenlyase transcriptional activator [Izhakiella capsodis]|uniref:Formate hydrogenlyase transcriptional activator n=1 Tax=Izhakiella capsodis TaxID=1367852 RepID=A0A1I4ZPW3_9GAMM|nr:formate hydrogenlyase transcriptional activator FlhA [Izhakiella capsodis]SFN52217.1 formate hydrogenlyase transcriptional activator [Izhakiella capsodis]
MSYTPNRSGNEQGFFEITRTLLQQPDFSALVQAISEYVRQHGFADNVNLLLWKAEYQSASLYSVDNQQQAIFHCDDALLASGPLHLTLSNSDVLYYPEEMFREHWPRFSQLNAYPPFRHYCLLPLVSQGRIIGGCEFLLNAERRWSESDLAGLQTLALVITLGVEHILSHRASDDVYAELYRERNDFRLLVAITNAVLSKLDLEELIAEVAREIHRNFGFSSISLALRSGSPGKLNLYSTHYIDDSAPLHDQVEVDEKGTLSEKVIKSKESLFLILNRKDKLAPYERMLFEMWRGVDQTLCLFPLIFSDRVLGVLKLSHPVSPLFTGASNIKLLRQVAERLAIAVDNALAYQEIRRLKERLLDENLALTEQINNIAGNFGEIIGRSEPMMTVMKQVEMVAQSDSTVLILGETGTGKELIARAIHKLSGRNERRMVKLNCAAVPAGLLESDLFGHERGAFTGASAQRIGRFELADRGTLFLDEVGDMPLELQPKLLRVLQDQEFERLGSNKVIRTNARLIAATNRDLKQMVSDREFRSDLYYRLNVFPIRIPPLRERPQDIPLLVKAFTFNISRRLGRNVDSIPAQTLKLLSKMEWPGNVRELENVIERAVLLTRSNVLQLSHADLSPYPSLSTCAIGGKEDEDADSGEDEYQRIVRVLKESNGVIAGPKGAAARLGLKRTTLLSRMKRFGIDKKALF